MSNMMLARCKSCRQTYCQECSDHSNWQDFCSERCEQDDAEENKPEHGGGK